MSYVVPQLLVKQEFLSAPAAQDNPLYAYIFGPHYHLCRFSDGFGLVDSYDGQTLTFDWPSLPTGAVVDSTFTKVFVKNALLKYWDDAVGASPAIYDILGYNNRIQAGSGVYFKDKSGYALATSFNGRDVQVGDIAHITGTGRDSTVEELWTRVVDILEKEMPGTVGTREVNTSNAGTTTAAVTVTRDSGNSTSATFDNTFYGYGGRADGHTIETYTVTVTSASTLSVVSASGTDDVVSQAITGLSPAYAGQLIGTRGLSLDWKTAHTVAVGDSWEIFVSQAFTATPCTAAGSFDSADDITYVVKVTTGGAITAAKITVTSITGHDYSAATVITGSAQNIGSKGVTVSLTDSPGKGYCKGDTWVIPCLGTRTNAQGYDTLVLADALDTHITGSSSSQGTGGGAYVDLAVQLYALKDLVSIPADSPASNSSNWTQDAVTGVTLGNSDIEVYDDEFVDSYGEHTTLVLGAEPSGLYNQIYIEYRALLQTYADGVYSLTAPEDVETTLGPVDTDNPLALGVYHALANSNGIEVFYMGVPTNDSDGYSLALDKASERNDLYTLVPVTTDPVIHARVAAHVDSWSGETKNKWRICFLTGLSENPKPWIGAGLTYTNVATQLTGVYDTETTGDMSPPMATVTGAAFTTVTWTNPVSGGGFHDVGVEAGDIFTTNYVEDSYGNMTYDSYVIDTVEANDVLTLVSGPAGAISSGQPFVVQKALSKAKEAAAYGATAGAFASRRVYYTWPDLIEDATGSQIPGFYDACAYAGLISGVVPQQGLTNMPITGFTSANRTTKYFTSTQLDTMAESGTWITSQSPTGEVYCRHEISTCTTDTKCSELLITKCVDFISRVFYSRLRPYIGRANITPRFIEQLRREILGTVDYLIGFGSTPTLGGPLISATITDLRQHAVLLDHVVIQLSIEVPYPVNVIELRLVV